MELVIKSKYLKLEKNGTYTFTAEREFKDGKLTRKLLSPEEAIKQVKRYEAGKKQLFPNEKLAVF